MKKLLVVLALCMVLSIVFVACETTPENVEDTTVGTNAPTTEETTEAPNTDETTGETTDAPTTEETTDAPTTEETTDAPTTEETTEPVPQPDPVITHLSFDQLYLGNGSPDSGENFFTPGQSSSWDGNAAIDMSASYITFWGWVGFYAENVGEFGYQIGDAEPVFSADFAFATEQGVVDAAAGAGAKSASRMKMAIPVYQLGAGETTVKALVKDAAGTIEVMKEFKVVKTVPYVDRTDAAAGFIGWSFDGFYLNEELYFAEDGNAASKLEAQDKIVPINYGADCFNIGFRGWVSFNQTTEAFGYFIAGVNTEIVFDEFIQERPDLAAAGIKNGVGFNVIVPTYDLGYGSYNVSIYAKLADGTIVQLYEITLTKINLSVDSSFGFATSIDLVNGNGAINADGSYAPHFSAIGGANTIGKIDATAAGKTTDKNGIITIGGWCGMNGGVDRYMWSIDGGNTWNEVLFGGGAERADLVAHFGNIGLTDAATGAYAFSGNEESFINIDLSEYAGTTCTLMIGAIPNTNTNIVVPIAELSNLTVAPVVETIWYDGENGTFTVPANFETKFIIRNAADQILVIENAFNYAITVTNLFTGETVTLRCDIMGKIEQVIPSDWGRIELTIANVTEEDSEITVQLLAPAAPESAALVLGENVVNAEVTPSGWNDVYFYTFTAEEAGDYTFTMTTDYAVGSLWYFEAPVYGMCDDNTVTLTLEAGQTVEIGVSADIVMGDLIGATENLVYGLGVNVTKA